MRPQFLPRDVVARARRWASLCRHDTSGQPWEPVHGDARLALGAVRVRRCVRCGRIVERQ